MELAMQIISDDKIVRSDTVQDLKDFNSQSLATQVEKGEKLFSMMPAIKKAFVLMGDDIVELTTENDSWKIKMGSFDEKRLKESKARLLNQIGDGKGTNLRVLRIHNRLKNSK